MPERAWEDEFTLLCERCGYVVEGLDPGGNCPECGKRIAESLPERRAGTAWQRKRGLVTLARTWWTSVRHPRRTLDTLQLGGHGKDRGLAISTMYAASILTTTAFLAPALFSIETGFVILFVLSLAPFFVLALLTMVESAGLWMIARSRGFRLDSTASMAIVAHGCVGWVLSALGYAMARAIIVVLVAVTTPAAQRTGIEGLDEYARIFASSPPVWVQRAEAPLIAACVIPGFLFFETFAWLGLRRCKFANRARPATTMGA